jgi:hypothetical protein
MAKKIAAWKAFDGSIHESEALCTEYERTVVRAKNIDELLSKEEWPSEDFPAGLRQYLLTNADEVVAALTMKRPAASKPGPKRGTRRKGVAVAIPTAATVAADIVKDASDVPASGSLADLEALLN